MQQELLIAMLAGLGGMLGWGFADFFAKVTVDKIPSIVSLVWAHVFGTLLFFLVAFYNVSFLGGKINIPSDLGEWAGLLFFGTLQAIVYLLVYIGFSKGQLALLNPVFASFSGLVAIFSIFVFGEKLSGNLLFALFIIFIGILFVSMDINALRSKKIKLTNIPGLKEIGIATILAAIWTLSWDKFVGGKDWISYALFMYLFMTLAAYVISKAQKANLKSVKPKIWKFLIFIGIGEVIAYLAISLGYSSTSLTSVVALVSGAFSIPTIILSYFFLKEKVIIVQRIGTFIIITGIIMLSLN